MHKSLAQYGLSSFETEITRRSNWLKNNSDTLALKNIKKIFSAFDSEEKQEITKAYEFSKDVEYLHPGLTSQAYFCHVLRVTFFCSKIKTKDKVNLINLALMHNILESSKTRIGGIKEKFGLKILKEIKILTVDRKREWIGNYKKNYYRNINKASTNVKIVKIFDKLNNIFLIKNNKNLKIKKRYLKEIEVFILPMVKNELPDYLSYFRELLCFCK